MLELTRNIGVYGKSIGEAEPNALSAMIRDHSVYAPSQWETALQCNAVSHWLDAYTKWSLC